MDEIEIRDKILQKLIEKRVAERLIDLANLRREEEEALYWTERLERVYDELRELMEALSRLGEN